MYQRVVRGCDVSRVWTACLQYVDAPRVLPLGSFLGLVCESSCVDPRKISLGKAFLAATPPHLVLADS